MIRYGTPVLRHPVRGSIKPHTDAWSGFRFSGLESRSVLVMTGRAIQHLALALPPADTFAVCTVHPVAGLFRMTLAAQHIGIVEIELFSFEGLQAAGPFQVMTGKTPEAPFAMQAMFQFEIVMRFLEVSNLEVALYPLMAT